MMFLKSNLVIFLCIRTSIVGEFMFPSDKLRSSQSQTLTFHMSYYAHDGRYDTYSYSTENPYTSFGGVWWEANLGSRRTVTAVKVFASTVRKYSNTLHNFAIDICEESLDENGRETCFRCALSPEGSLKPGENVTMKCGEKHYGQFVVLSKLATKDVLSKQLAIAEINIFIE